MSKVIIAIHGLGNKPPKDLLTRWGMQAIEEGMQKLGVERDLPDFQLVYWADLVYDRPQTMEEKNPKSPYYLDEIYTKAPRNFKPSKHTFYRKFADLFKVFAYHVFLKEDFRLRYPGISKKMIHNYFHELEIYFTKDCGFPSSESCEVKDKIINRLKNTLEKHRHKEIMLLSHSMGSIIAFDVISFIAKEIDIHTFITMGSPLGAPFVISRIAEHSRKVYGQVELQTPESVRKNWFNFSDILDKIALDYKLAEDFKPNSHGVKVRDFLVNNDYVMNGISNPHKSFGYLRTPEFIRVLVDFLDE